MSFFTNLITKLSPVGVLIVALILAVFVISLIVNLAIRRRYISILNSLENKQQRRTGHFKSDILNKIVEEYKSAAGSNTSEVNTQAIIEKCFKLKMRGLFIGERFVKHTVSILVILGLLGTFLGLTISVGELVRLLGNSSSVEIVTNFSSIIDGLLYSVSGMAVAFVTSLVGIGCSIIITLLGIIIDCEEARETLMVNIEEYLDNYLALTISNGRENEYTRLNKALKEAFTEFGAKIESSLQKAVNSIGDRLSNTVMDVSLSSKALESTVEKFDASLKRFAVNIKDFSEFNNSLKNNIERMDVNFIKVTDALKNASKIIVDNYALVERFSKDIRSATDEMSSYNKQIVQDVSSLVGEVKITVSSVKELGEVLSRTMETRTRDVEQYQRKFNEIMQKLSNQIDTLGMQTAEAFSKNLEESSKLISAKISENVESVLKEIFVMLSSFKENEKLFAKTIAMLPEQAMTYSQASAAKLGKQLDEVKELLKSHRSLQQP